MNIWVFILLSALIVAETLLLVHHWRRSVRRGKIIDKKNVERTWLRSDYELCLDWLIAQGMNRRVDDYFNRMDYKRIAVYGVGDIGQIFLDYMEKSNVEVAYCIDAHVERVYAKVPVIKPNEVYPPVDAVVICVAHGIDAIKSRLSGKVNCPVVSLAEALFCA